MLFHDRLEAGRILAEGFGTTAIGPTCWCSRCRAAACPWPLKSPRRSTHRSTYSWSANSAFPATKNWRWGRSPRAAFARSTATSSSRLHISPADDRSRRRSVNNWKSSGSNARSDPVASSRSSPIES